MDATANPKIGGPLTILADFAPTNWGPKGWTGFLGLSPPVALPGPVPLSPRAGNWLVFRFLYLFGPFQSPGFKITVPKAPPVPPGVKFSLQAWLVNPSPGLPIYSVSNGLLLRHVAEFTTARALAPGRGRWSPRPAPSTIPALPKTIRGERAWSFIACPFPPSHYSLRASSPRIPALRTPMQNP